MKKIFATAFAFAMLPTLGFAEKYDCHFIDIPTLQAVGSGSIDTDQPGLVRYSYEKAGAIFQCSSVRNSETKDVDLMCGITKPGAQLFETPMALTNAGAKKLALSGSIGGHPLAIDCRLVE